MSPTQDICPSDLQLIAFAGGDLLGQTSAQLAIHLSGCATCTKRLADLRTKSSGFESTAEGSSPPTTFFSGASDPAGEAVHHPEQIARYRVERLLGEGGFGRVYLAHDGQLDRAVAIKVPKADLFTFGERTGEYLNEARTVAKLDHPNIVPVYDSGSSGEFPVYFVSKYIAGSSLAEMCRAPGCLSHRQIAATVATVAEALHYAHLQGFVHRDIKPGNILVDSSGKAFVVDFGVALHEEQLGEGPLYAGTVAYMSPEQAQGKGNHVDGRSDVFSLGVVFYELLVGKRPFAGTSPTELMNQIVSYEARPLRAYDASIPRELERICLRSLEKKVTDRYTTAQDMADDLRGWLRTTAIGGELSDARKDSPVWRALLYVGAAVVLAGCALLVWREWKKETVLRQREAARELEAGVTGVRSEKGTRKTDIPDRLVARQTPPGVPAREGTGVDAAADVRLRGTIAAHLANDEDPSRHGVRTDQSLGLPVRMGDGVKVEASVSQPAFLYIVWIDAMGAVIPIYPWDSDWTIREGTDRAVKTITRPEGQDDYWEMDSVVSGTETLVLLARREPLPKDIRIDELIGELPELRVQLAQPVVSFSESETSEPERAPKTLSVKQIANPVLTRHRQMIERLGSHFELVWPASFAYQAE